MKRLIIAIFALIILSSVAYAHIPYYTCKNYTEIKEPEISKAFYGVLDRPRIYEINSDKPFHLYANILGPYAEEKPNLNFEVYTKEGTLYKTGNISWKYFWEEYGRDDYWMGAEFSKNVTSGTYYIKVTGEGRYSLAVGDIENFNAKAIARTVITLPLVKAMIFHKYLLVSVASLVLLLILFILYKKFI